MINPLYKKLAQLVVNYSLNIKKGERVIIDSPTIAEAHRLKKVKSFLTNYLKLRMLIEWENLPLAQIMGSLNSPKK